MEARDSSLQNNYQTGCFPRDYISRGVKLTTHLHLVPRLRMSEAISALVYTPSCRDNCLTEQSATATLTTTSKSFTLARTYKMKDCNADDEH
jgi:hypothetical protein